MTSNNNKEYKDKQTKETFFKAASYPKLTPKPLKLLLRQRLCENVRNLILRTHEVYLRPSRIQHLSDPM